jgi:hypothetical protein
MTRVICTNILLYPRNLIIVNANLAYKNPQSFINRMFHVYTQVYMSLLSCCSFEIVSTEFFIQINIS